MAGFDPQAARREFSLPDDVEPVVAIAVGKPVDADILGHEALIDRERAPRRRLPLSEIALSDWNVPAF